MKCPECGNKMEKAADWSDDWLVCLNCLYCKKVEEDNEKD